MKRANYKTIPLLIKYGEEFVANSVKGEYVTGDKSSYRVSSYNTPIFTASEDGAIFDNRYYSVTTSRIQNIVRHMLEVSKAGDDYIPGRYEARRLYEIEG